MLENEFLFIIKPLHIISSLFCLQKFHLSENNVTSYSKKNVFFSILGVFVVFYLLFLTLSALVNMYDNLNIFYVYIIAYSQYPVNYTILSIYTFYQSKFYVKLILKLQAIDRTLHDFNQTKKIKLLVWTTSFLLLVAYVLFITFKILYDPLWDWVRGTFIVTSLIFDIELTYSIFFVYFLACKTKRWSQILQVDERNPNVLQDNIGITLVETLFNIYEEILDAIVLTKEAVQFTILLHIVIVFIQSLTYIEILIMMTQNQKIEPVAVTSHAFGVGIWISKAVLTETTFCIICEMLYRRIVSTQIAAVTFKTYYDCRDARRFLKNMQRLYKVQFKKLKIYGIFTIDAPLPLRLGRLIADYTVILLQFAFLRK